jgi:hypothetical protein
MESILLSGLACLILGLTLWRWSFGLYIIVVWDAIRDPIRKLLPDNVAILAAFGGGLWICCMLGCLADDWRNGRWHDLRLPQTLRWIVGLLCVYVCIGLTAGLMNSISAVILMLGFVSTIMPLPGLIAGRGLGKHPKLLARLLAFSCVLNSILVGSAFLDLAGLRTSILGGIQMEWYRMRAEYSIPLPSGVFRSPDVLGLHVAYVLAFAIILCFASAGNRSRALWQGLAVWGGIVLLFAARRKMVGFTVVFLVVFAGLLRQRKLTDARFFLHDWSRRKRLIIATAFILVGVVTLYFGRRQLEFAATTFVQFPERIFASSGAIKNTIHQSGVWGMGLGVVTQGRNHLVVSDRANWQEDGLSRFVLEAGVVGGAIALASMVIFLIGSTKTILSSFRDSIGSHDDIQRGVLHAGTFSLVVANLACGAISHLHLSGDPVSLGFFGFFAGCLWAPSESAA